MPNDLLRLRAGIPLEREYEAWITAGIDAYFTRAGRKAVIFAVSPQREKKWPADEELRFDGKLIGLQIKRPHFTAGGSYDDIHWQLHLPNPQLQAVQQNSEIFYCLPTFINRGYRHVALHHCLFWRPADESDKRKMVWYGNNPDAHDDKAYTGVGEKWRWGRFLEEIDKCPGGKLLEKDEVADHLDGLQGAFARLYGEGEYHIPLIYIEEREGEQAAPTEPVKAEVAER